MEILRCDYPICVQIELWSGLLPWVLRAKFSCPQKEVTVLRVQMAQYSSSVSSQVMPWADRKPLDRSCPGIALLAYSWLFFFFFLSLHYCLRASCSKEEHKLQAYLELVSLMPSGVLEKYQDRYFTVVIVIWVHLGLLFSLFLPYRYEKLSNVKRSLEALPPWGVFCACRGLLTCHNPHLGCTHDLRSAWVGLLATFSFY